MSNILIIKHGSLGDIAQISGVLKDIKQNHVNDNIFILTTLPYVELLSNCPSINVVLIDKRSPRWNVIYLYKLRKMINRYKFSIAYDLQNSSRTNFYRNYLFNILSWSSTKTTLKKSVSKKDFDKGAVLERFKYQLENSKLKINYSLRPDFSWACTNVDSIVNKYLGKKFILIFPFCSPDLTHKQWPYYNELINIIKEKNYNLEIVVAPGPNELDYAKKIEAISITNNSKPLNIMQLAGLIKKSSFVVANDTGPAHMAAHLGKSGVVLFGHHTTPEKVSIETENFKAITVKNLKELKPHTVYSEIENQIKTIND
jgi:ADP-heptose:LPS heptosyltransferase